MSRHLAVTCDAVVLLSRCVTCHELCNVFTGLGSASDWVSPGYSVRALQLCSGQSRRGGPLLRDEPPAEAKYTGTVLCLGAWVKIAPLTTPAHGKSENRLRGSGLLMSSSYTHILIFLVVHCDCIKYDLLHFGYPMFTGKHFSTVQVPQNNSFYQHQRKTSQRTDSVIINMIFVTVRKY